MSFESLVETIEKARGEGLEAFEIRMTETKWEEFRNELLNSVSPDALAEYIPSASDSVPVPDWATAVVLGVPVRIVARQEFRTLSQSRDAEFTVLTRGSN